MDNFTPPESFLKLRNKIETYLQSIWNHRSEGVEIRIIKLIKDCYQYGDEQLAINILKFRDVIKYQQDDEQFTDKEIILPQIKNLSSSLRNLQVMSIKSNNDIKKYIFNAVYVLMETIVVYIRFRDEETHTKIKETNDLNKKIFFLEKHKEYLEKLIKSPDGYSFVDYIKIFSNKFNSNINNISKDIIEVRLPLVLEMIRKFRFLLLKNQNSINSEIVLKSYELDIKNEFNGKYGIIWQSLQGKNVFTQDEIEKAKKINNYLQIIMGKIQENIPTDPYSLNNQYKQYLEEHKFNPNDFSKEDHQLIFENLPIPFKDEMTSKINRLNTILEENINNKYYNDSYEQLYYKYKIKYLHLKKLLNN